MKFPLVAGLFSNYSDYLASELWQEKSNYLKEKIKHCQICGLEKQIINEIYVCIDYLYASRMDELNKLSKDCRNRCCGHKKEKHEVLIKRDLIVHHKNYESVGNENEEDLIVLCRDCHAKIHKS